VQFRQCSFSQLGAWGLRLFNGTQHALVSRCTFDDLSGGGICVGNVDDSFETRPRYQMAFITVEDNEVTNVGREYKGSPGIHSFCMRQSSISHNYIKGVPYTGEQDAPPAQLTKNALPITDESAPRDPFGQGCPTTGPLLRGRPSAPRSMAGPKSATRGTTS
jgi:hypothetical protein